MNSHYQFKEENILKQKHTCDFALTISQISSNGPKYYCQICYPKKWEDLAKFLEIGWIKIILALPV